MVHAEEFNSTDFNRKPIRLAVLASGSGSNFEALVNYCRNQKESIATVSRLVINNPGCGAQKRADLLKVPSRLINHRDYSTREQFDQAVADLLKTDKIDLVIMAGWMRIVTASLINNIPCGCLINIHPSLLPAFKGANAIADALAAGAIKSGCSIHEVVLDVDSGPLLAQAEVNIEKNDTVESLHLKIQKQEHLLLPPIVIAKARQLGAINEELLGVN
jgi:phosphoribosylglycinamide formyltransferase-1